MNKKYRKKDSHRYKCYKIKSQLKTFFHKISTRIVFINNRKYKSNKLLRSKVKIDRRTIQASTVQKAINLINTNENMVENKKQIENSTTRLQHEA